MEGADVVRADVLQKMAAAPAIQHPPVNEIAATKKKESTFFRPIARPVFL
jgi:hypothetical protein